MFDIAIRIEPREERALRRGLAMKVYPTSQLGAFSVECATDGHGRSREGGCKCCCHEKYVCNRQTL